MYDLSKLVAHVSDCLLKLDTPRSLTVKILLDNRDFKGIAQLTCDPRNYLSVDDYIKDSFATNILRKLDIGANLEVETFEVWKRSEEQCARTNNTIRTTIGFMSPLQRARNIIARTLGAVPDITKFGRHGPGAAMGSRGYGSEIHRKMSAEPTLTYNAMHTWRFFSNHQWVRHIREEGRPITVVKGNQLVFVPKDAKIARPIAIEPSFNMYVQLGIGECIRSRLKHRVGIDLNNGQAYHRALVAASSRTNELATLDLSSASDTISYELVRELLPPAWFLLLDTYRSAYTEYAGKQIKLEKFSAMGCGFTFELETLIFYAICKSQAEFCSVYGDDIIVDSKSVNECIYLLEYCGFSLNRDKSFYGEEYFRESCGYDSFHGRPVRMPYIKSIPTSREDLYVLANQLYKVGLENPYFYYAYLRNFRNSIIGCIPKRERFFGPVEIPGTLADDNVGKYTIMYKHGMRFVRGWTVGRRPFKPHVKPRVAVALALLGYSDNTYITRYSEPYEKIINFHWV